VLKTTDSRALTYDTSWNLLAERTLDGKQAASYIHGLRTDEIIRSEITNSSDAKSKTVYPLADGLDSTVALADAKGMVTERSRYDAYGVPHFLSDDYRPKPSDFDYRFLFTGRE